VQVKAYIRLSEDLAERFLRIKEHLGLKNNTEVIRYLINDYWNKVIEKPK